MRIIVLNNYDLEYTLKEWKQDGQSAHQLWGVTQMEEYGIQPSLLKYIRFTLLKELSDKTKFLGDIDQEMRVLLEKQNYDLIFSGHYITTSLLALLRKLKILRKPLIAVAFQAPRKSFFSNIYVKLFVSGNDKLICLSEGIKDHFEKDFNISPEKLEFIEWGYDTNFHKPKSLNLPNVCSNGYILSTGKSFRDYQTLIEAFSGINYTLNIIGYSDNILDSLGNLPNNINMTIPFKAFSGGKVNRVMKSKLNSLSRNVKTIDRLLKTSEMVEEYTNALAVAIPLDLPMYKPYNTVGLSSLLEAMCMGRAVITTENRDIGIDVEKEGIGLTVPHKDVTAWKQAIQYLLNHPEQAYEMGVKARFLAEKRFNLQNFTQRTTQCMKSLAQCP